MLSDDTMFDLSAWKPVNPESAASGMHHEFPWVIKGKNDVLSENI